MTDTANSFEPPSIVVGIDGSRAGERAALWAVDEAVGRELPLRLVAVVEDPASRRRAEAAVASAASAVASDGRPVGVGVEVVAGESVAALLDASRSAAMICLGAVGLSRAEHRVGSTVSALVASARCPVAVVRGSAPPDGWVVAELDDTPDSAAVLQFGVDEARLRRVPLRVLGTWQSDDRDGPGVDEGNRLVRARLDRNIETWRHRYPDLDVEPIAVHGGPMDYLGANAEAIGLVVIGARDVVAVNELLGPAGLAALPRTTVLILDRQRLL